jgi:hypothetical protein
MQIQGSGSDLGTEIWSWPASLVSHAAPIRRLRFDHAALREAARTVMVCRKVSVPCLTWANPVGTQGPTERGRANDFTEDEEAGGGQKAAAAADEGGADRGQRRMVLPAPSPPSSPPPPSPPSPQIPVPVLRPTGVGEPSSTLCPPTSSCMPYGLPGDRPIVR